MSEFEPAGNAGASRQREHPEARFAAEQHVLDLAAVARDLAAGPARRGQRQMTLYQHGRVTIALFTFEAGAGLADHVAAGVVTIHVIEGRLRLNAGGTAHDLSAGKILVLAPNVRHDVQAETDAMMLLHVSLEDPSGARKQ